MREINNKNTNKKDFEKYLDSVMEMNSSFKECNWSMTTKKQGEYQTFSARFMDENYNVMFAIKIKRFHPLVEPPKIERFKEVNGYLYNPLRKSI